MSNIVRLVESRSSDRLAAEWDQLASHREELIASGRDLSYHHVLLPSLTDLLGSLSMGGRVLDAGCSTGVFLSQLADSHSDVDFLGIDPSANSIGIAQARRSDLGNCEFRVMTVEELAANHRGEFTAIIANMLLQNVASFTDVMAACASLLAPGGTFVFAVPHPVFWSRYRCYDGEPWFRYDRESWIEVSYRTSLSVDSDLCSTHAHRPLNAYLNGFRQVGMVVDEIREPMPDRGVAYPVAWEFPRFLTGRCVLA